MRNIKAYKIVASDLDGTLLDKNQTVSRENLRAIAEMRRRGIEFVPTTGRSLGEMPFELLESDDIRYIITSDGSAIWDKASGAMTNTNYLTRDKVRFILDVKNSFNTYPLVHEGGNTHFDKTRHTKRILDECRVGEGYRYVVDRRAVGQDDYDGYLLSSDEVEMFCLFFDNDEDLERARRIFEVDGGLSVAQSSPTNLEIYMPAAGKGNALSSLANTLGADISEVIAVGDSTNDSSLVGVAGLGLAMSNACDELKGIADETICSNDEHCAKYILENYIALE